MCKWVPLYVEESCVTQHHNTPRIHPLYTHYTCTYTIHTPNHTSKHLIYAPCTPYTRPIYTTVGTLLPFTGSRVGQMSQGGMSNANSVGPDGEGGDWAGGEGVKVTQW